MDQFLKEILEQPYVIERISDFYLSDVGFDLLKRSEKFFKSGNIGQVVFTGMGSSYFVSHAAATLFNDTGIPSFVLNTSEFLHYNLSLLKGGMLLFCISQSGESFEIKELLKRLPSSISCIGIVNEERSSLALKADVALLCKAGEEKMTSTKSYVATTLAILILNWHIMGKWNKVKCEVIKKLSRDFDYYLKSCQLDLQKYLDFMGNIETLQIIARGPAFSTASQSALMFKEALHIPATGILGGEFRHGPMEMVSKGFKAILFAAVGKTFNQSIKMAKDIAAFGGKVLLITNVSEESVVQNVFQIFIDEPDEFLFSIKAIIPVQLFVDGYARQMGFDAGSFSRGAKVTTIE